jgi:hypothetical protein
VDQEKVSLATVGGGAKIPGIEVYEETVIAAGGRR